MSVRDWLEAVPRRRDADAPALRPLPGMRPVTLASLPFAGFVIAILALGMVGLLALNVYLGDQSRALTRAQKTAEELSLRASALQAEALAHSAPGNLAAAAAALGMVPNANPPVYIELETGKILGKPIPVTGHEMPALKVAPVSLVTANVPVVTVQSSIQTWLDFGPAAAPAPAASAKASTSPKPTAPAASTKPTKAASPAPATPKPTPKATPAATKKP